MLSIRRKNTFIQIILSLLFLSTSVLGDYLDDCLALAHRLEGNETLAMHIYDEALEGGASASVIKWARGEQLTLNELQGISRLNKVSQNQPVLVDLSNVLVDSSPAILGRSSDLAQDWGRLQKTLPVTLPDELAAPLRRRLTLKYVRHVEENLPALLSEQHSFKTLITRWEQLGKELEGLSRTEKQAFKSKISHAFDTKARQMAEGALQRSPSLDVLLEEKEKLLRSIPPPLSNLRSSIQATYQEQFGIRMGRAGTSQLRNRTQVELAFQELLDSPYGEKSLISILSNRAWSRIQGGNSTREVLNALDDIYDMDPDHKWFNGLINLYKEADQPSGVTYEILAGRRAIQEDQAWRLTHRGMGQSKITGNVEYDLQKTIRVGSESLQSGEADQLIYRFVPGQPPEIFIREVKTSLWMDKETRTFRIFEAQLLKARSVLQDGIRLKTTGEVIRPSYIEIIYSNTDLSDDVEALLRGYDDLRKAGQLKLTQFRP